MICTSKPYTLPTVEFIGGTTTSLLFRTYFKDTSRQFDLSCYSAVFSLINYVNEYGIPFSKDMEITEELNPKNNEMIPTVLRVTLTPDETKNLEGKYIYQIMINGSAGESESQQGIFYIYNNIDKNNVGMYGGIA